AQIAAAAGALALAEQSYAAAEALHPKGQRSWAVPLERGQLCERRGDRAGAEAAYRRAIAAVEALRQGAGTLAPHVIASHRQPYEALLGLYAASGRWPDALALVAALDAGALVTSEQAPRELVPA